MPSSRSPRICLVPKLSGVGGMVSFQHRLAAGLAARGIPVSYDLTPGACDTVLVVGGTRHLAGLYRARRAGARIVQRLDGMNWLHRVRRPGLRQPSLRHILRAEYGNFILAVIRARLADQVVYQSDFSRRWWERIHGPATVPWSVVYNGVDLDHFTAQGAETPPEDVWRILMVEGSLMGGYEQGLAVGAALAQGLAQRIQEERATVAVDGSDERPVISRLVLPRPVELMVAGRVSPDLQRHWDARLAAAGPPGSVRLNWAGLVRREDIPRIDRSAHLLYSADIHPACPNSVIEALACGLPVVAFDTGALTELVAGDAGRVVPYGGDAWRLDPPDLPALIQAAENVLAEQERFRATARARAEAAFGLDQMVAGYLEALE